MTASLHLLGTGAEAGNYYTLDSAREAKPRGRDEYYASDGGGLWWSSGETIVRHGALIDRGTFRDLCAGYDPSTGKPLVRGAGTGHRAGLDITFTPGKSVSVLWAAGDERQRALIEAAQQAAVDRALRYVIDEGLVVVRTGAGGIEHHRPSDLIVARFAHYTTRAGDPNVHTHCVIMNVAGAPLQAQSRRYATRNLTAEWSGVYHWKLVIGAAYRAELAKHLAHDFGVTFREAGQGQWEIAGITETVLEAFSKRSAHIKARVRLGASSAQKELAALATRQGKDKVPTGDALETRWRHELTRLGADVWAQARTPAQTVDQDLTTTSRDLDPPEIPGDGPVAAAASALLRHESVIRRKSLYQAALTRAALVGRGVDAVQTEIADLERAGILFRLAGSAQGTSWTTPAIAACEAAMLRAAHRLEDRAWFSDGAVTAAFENASHLSQEQQAAVRHAAGPGGVAILEAGAGTGKTVTAKALVDAARGSALRVVGLAPSWVAADEFAKATGVKAQAVALWRRELEQGWAERTDERTLLIVDEAGMVGTRDMAAILAEAQASGAKVVLIGDRRQLGSVSGASALRAVAQVVDRSAVLQEVRRQTVDWQKAASVVMARGDAEAGLRAYAARGHVELVSGDAAAQERTIAIWREQRARYGDDVLIVTRRNRDAAALNLRARDALKEDGLLGPDLVTAPSVNRDGQRVPLVLAVGDHVRFGETLSHLSVRNGNRAIVRAIRTELEGQLRLTLELEDGRMLDEDWARLAQEPRFGRKLRPPCIVHAYAGTAYAAQGRTAEAAVLYTATPTDAREVYVGLTRHRHDVRIVVEQDRLDALCRQSQADQRIPPTRTALLERLFREANQYRDKANVVDYVEDKGEFLRTGQIVFGPREVGVRRAARAARTLVEAAEWLGVAPILMPAWRLVQQTIGRKATILRRRALTHDEPAAKRGYGMPTLDL